MIIRGRKTCACDAPPAKQYPSNSPGSAFDDDGISVWEISSTFNHLDGDELLIDVFPARTTIRWPLGGNDEH